MVMHHIIISYICTMQTQKYHLQMTLILEGCKQSFYVMGTRNLSYKRSFKFLNVYHHPAPNELFEGFSTV